MSSRIVRLLHRASIVLAAALSAGCGTPGGATATDAGGTAARYLEAIGGREVVGSLRTIHTVDSVWMAGLAGTSESWWIREPFAGRISMRIGPVSQELLISGDSVWSVDRNGAMSSGDGMARSQAALARLTVFQDAFLDPSTHGVTAGPDTVLDGREAVRLDFDAGCIPVSYFFSRESGLPVLIRTEALGMDVLSRPGGFVETGGMLFPGFTSDSIPALGQATRSSSVLIECNRAFPDSVFMIAAGSGDAELPLPGVPHRFDLDGQHIYVAGTVCGREIDILLDSGAGATVLDASVAAGLGLVPAGEFSAMGVAGTETFGFAEVPEYSALGATVRGQTLALMDLDAAFHPSTGHHIGMILGYDFLSRFVTAIDYGAETVTLLSRDGFTPGGGTILPAERMMSVLVVDAVLEDSIPVRLILDTGAGGALHLGADFLRSHQGFMSGRETRAVSVGGVGGRSETSVFRVGTVTLGDFRVPAGLSSSIGDLPVVSGCDGILGAAVLARFEVWLDYGAPRVVLERSSLFIEGLPEDLAGFAAEIDGDGLVVTEVMERSPAEEAGLSEGDRIVSLDGVEIGADLPALDSLMSGMEGDARHLRVLRGSEIREFSVILRALL